MNEITRILSAIEKGEPHASDQLLPLLYDELRKLAARKLAHEALWGTAERPTGVWSGFRRKKGGRSSFPKRAASAAFPFLFLKG